MYVYKLGTDKVPGGSLNIGRLKTLENAVLEHLIRDTCGELNHFLSGRS